MFLASCLRLDVVDEGTNLPRLQGEDFCQGPAEVLGDKCGSDYSSPSSGSTLSAVVVILMARASSQVKSGFSRRFTT